MSGWLGNQIPGEDRSHSRTEQNKGNCRSKRVPMLRIRNRLAAALVLAIVFSLLFFTVMAGSSHNSQVGCSKTCVAENCNSIGIRYGKYCGVGWSGCQGEKPCDDLDACCKIHDECVEKHGLTNIKCHEKFKKCIKKVQKSGKAGFSRDCPFDIAVPTMIQGMDMAILFSQFGNSKIEL